MSQCLEYVHRQSPGCRSFFQGSEVSHITDKVVTSHSCVDEAFRTLGRTCVVFGSPFPRCIVAHACFSGVWRVSGVALVADGSACRCKLVAVVCTFLLFRSNGRCNLGKIFPAEICATEVVPSEGVPEGTSEQGRMLGPSGCETGHHGVGEQGNAVEG